MISRIYKHVLGKVYSHSLPLFQSSDDNCSKIRFDNFGQSIEVLCRLLVFSSDVYLSDELIGCFYGRSLGFWGATNCVCCIGEHRIRFRNVKEGVCALNARTGERLLLSIPRNKFLSRLSGRMMVSLADNTEMIIAPPKVAVFSQSGLPSYASFKFDDGTIIRMLLYGRGSAEGERAVGKCFNGAIHPDDVGMLHKVHSRISTTMLLSIAMYFRMYMNTRWLIG